MNNCSQACGVWHKDGLLTQQFLRNYYLLLKKKIKMYTDFGGNHFPDENKDDPWYVLLASQPPDSAASPRIFYWL